MNISQQIQTKNQETSKIRIKTQDKVKNSKSQDGTQCKFFTFSCSSQSQKNQQTLMKQKSQLIQKQINLGKKKSIQMSRLLNKHFQQKNQNKKVLKTPKPYSQNDQQIKQHNLSFSSSKGIGLSLKIKNIINQKIEDKVNTVGIQKQNNTRQNIFQSLQKQIVPVTTSNFKIESQNCLQNEYTTNNKKIYNLDKSLTFQEKNYISKNQTYESNRLSNEKGKSPVNFHFLNPLSIDRKKYQSKQIKIGGQRTFHEPSNHNFPQFHIVGPKKVSFTQKNQHLIETKPHTSIQSSKIIYHSKSLNDSFKSPLTTTHYKYNYANNTTYNKSRNQFRIQNFNVQPMAVSAINNHSLFNLQVQQNQSFNKNNLRQIYHSPFNSQNINKQSQNILNPNLNSSLINQLGNSAALQTYSDRYREYMAKQLALSNMQSLFECVNIECKTQIQEHVTQNNQRQWQINEQKYKQILQQQDQNQNKLNYLQNDKEINHNYLVPSSVFQKRQNRKQSFASSLFIGSEHNKEQEIQNVRNMYNQQNNNVVQKSNVDSNMNRNYEQSDLLKKEIYKESYINRQRKGYEVSMPAISNLQLHQEIQLLFRCYNSLLLQQQQLNSKLSTFSLSDQVLSSSLLKENSKTLILQSHVAQLQALKQISLQRQEQIQSLKEIIRIKKLRQQLNKSSQIKSRLIDDQNGWQEYIMYDGNIEDKILQSIGSTVAENQEEKFNYNQI